MDILELSTVFIFLVLLLQVWKHLTTEHEGNANPTSSATFKNVSIVKGDLTPTEGAIYLKEGGEIILLKMYMFTILI